LHEESFRYTQEFLAHMLGTDRSSVTLAAGIMKRAGLIDYSRGKITILDREGLEDVACECYEVMTKELEDLLKS
jgi:Mn-dependent DtxR family transcriptional regulator